MTIEEAVGQPLSIPAYLKRRLWAIHMAMREINEGIKITCKT